jgi:hypothetical protein
MKVVGGCVLLLSVLAAASTTVSFYELLGVSQTASTREIRKAFKVNTPCWYRTVHNSHR